MAVLLQAFKECSQVMHQDLPSVLLDWSRVDVEAPTPGGDLIVDKTCRTARWKGTRGRGTNLPRNKGPEQK